MKSYLGVAVALAIVLVAGTLASAQQLQSIQVEKVVSAHVAPPVSARLPQSPTPGIKQVPGIRLAQSCSARCGVPCAIPERCWVRGHRCLCDCCARCLQIPGC
jgi:hypothetical protein